MARSRLSFSLFSAASLSAACARHEPRRAVPVPGASATALVTALSPSGSSSTAVSAPAPATALACPSGMSLLPGGSFWVGADERDHYSEDESPRYRTTLAPFCLDQTEVTLAAYAACVTSGRCSPAVASHSQCNAAHHDRPDYPVNCVTWTQADAYCRSLGRRLPSETEWEFAARGGEKYLKYPWGDENPDGHACWKHGGGSCPTKAYAADSFGLFDLSGNVWEWTDTWYGPYPWPPETGFSKVYRGGSWSRRFEKWMHTRLRNRSKPSDQGSHLGFRCALIPDLARCPFGKADERRCLDGVNERACPEKSSWNGVRCAGADAPRCPAGRVERSGYGCVLGEPEKANHVDLEAEARSVTRSPAPEFAADCAANFGDRPRPFKYSGGTHEARNLVSRRAGCKNRDVGVGWNSTCCP